MGGIDEAKRRQAQDVINDLMERSAAAAAKSRAATSRGGGLTHRMMEGSANAQTYTALATQLEAAVRDGIDLGIADADLIDPVSRVLELQGQAAEQAAAANEAAQARSVLAAQPIRTPRAAEWRAFGTPRSTRPPVTQHAHPFQSGYPTAVRSSRRASSPAKAPAAAPPAEAPPALMREGSLVQLRGLDGASGLSYSGYGNFDVHLGQYNLRKGRVSRDPPPWVIKAATTSKSVAAALVPVLLDSRSTDRDRGAGIWVAVPPEYLRVL